MLTVCKPESPLGEKFPPQLFRICIYVFAFVWSSYDGRTNGKWHIWANVCMRIVSATATVSTTESTTNFCSTWNEIMCHNSIAHVRVASPIFVHRKSFGDTPNSKYDFFFFFLAIVVATLTSHTTHTLGLTILPFACSHTHHTHERNDR